jgi:predicted nucleotidyltransferase
VDILDIARFTELNNELTRMVGVIIEKYNPETIILFGSTAGGNVNEWSDLDLVVIKDTQKSFYERLEEVVEIAQPNIGADIIVYTPDEAEQMKDDLFFKEEVINKGKVLFSTKPNSNIIGTII